MKRFLTKWTFSLLLLIGMTAVGTAQSVSGVVTDAANGEALIGANILVKGTSTGTITDVDGSYSVAAKAGDVLVISYTGYEDQEVTVGNSNTVNVSLSAGKLLDEVVVVGYGTQTKKEITSAVSSISKEDFNKGPISDPMQLLQGKVAGLSIYNRGGNPNQASTIRLRGLSTVGANTEPLIVVDGVIGASLNNIDPNDIESMDVLKDGSAAAIYGSRGSSGVILITTKKGSRKNEGITLSYNGQVGRSTLFNEHQIMSPQDFVKAGGTDLGSNTVWLDEITRAGINQVHSISAEGGGGKTTYRISGNIRNQNGILKNSGLEQLNARANISTKALNDKLNIDFTSSFTQRDQNFGFDEAFRYAMVFNPTAPVTGDKSPFPFASSQFGGYFEMLGLFDAFNPVSIIEQNKNQGRRNEFIYGLNLGYNLTESLTANVRVAQQNNTFNGSRYYPTTSHFRGNATSPTRKGIADFNSSNFKQNLIETYLSKIIDLSGGSLNVMGGYSYQQTNVDGYNFSIGDFPNNDIDFRNNIGTAQDLQNRGFIGAGSFATPDDKIIAGFARANLTLNSGIFASASVRREGSTKLGEGNKWGWFPALSVGADLNQFLDLNNVDQLKARVGYGVTGALPRENGLSRPIRNIINAADGAVSTQLVRAANPDLKWESKRELNIGVDFAAGKFNGSVDVYNRDIQDFILGRNVDPAVFGVNRRVENVGKLNTRGWEVNVNYNAIQNGDVSYTTGLMLSGYTSKLQEYVQKEEMRGNLGAPGQNSTNMILVREGEKIGQIWGPVFDKVNAEGAPTFKDLNGDGKIIGDADKALDPDADFQVLGQGLPTLELGWNNTLNIKGWNINAFFRGAFGHSLVNTFRAFYEPRLGSQTSYNFLNTELAVDGLTSARFSSLYVEKADFFKLDNFTISRGISTGSGSAIRNLNVGLTIQNAFVITKYTGADPEPALVYYGAADNGGVEDRQNPDVLAPGIDSRNNYFAARTITLGLNFNF